MLRALFVFAILGPGLYQSLRSRYAALLTYLWVGLFRPQDWLWIDISQFRVSMVLGLLLLVPSVMTGIAPNITHPLSIGMVMFLVSTLLSQMTAVQPAIGWEWIDFAARLFVACLLLVTLVSGPRRFAGVAFVIGASFGFHAAKAGLAFIAGGGTRFGDGLAGAFVDSNGYALGTVMIMPLLVAAAQNISALELPHQWMEVWGRRALYAAVPLCMLAVVGTYSRGGFLALCAAFLTFLLCQRRRFTALAAIVGIVGLVVTLVPIPQSYVDRLQTISTYEQVGDDSAMSRPHFWRVGVNMGLSRMFGVGLRQYEAAYDQYDFLYGRYGHQRAVHSAHIQVFAELGVLGEAVWVFLFGYAIFTCVRIRSRSRDERLPPDEQRLLFTMANALLVSMVAFLVGGSFLALALNDLTWLTFAMVAALHRISKTLPAQKAPQSQPLALAPRPLAFRAFDSVATGRIA